MKKKEKRGLSTIVIALIIILVSLVAVGIVWIVIKNLLTSGTKEIGFGKFTIDLKIKNAYEQAGNITVNVERKSGGGELVKIKFILSDGKTSEAIIQNANLGELESKIFSLHPTQLAPTQVASVSVAPIFKTAEGNEAVGEITSTYNIISGGVAPGAESGPICIPNCLPEWQCGEDPVCGQSCGTCPAGSSCINHVCVPPGPCTPKPDAEICGAWVCGTKVNNCGEIVVCGTCPPGQMCSSGTCTTITPINSGKVEETWPGTSGMYFGSSSLPKDVSYQGYYVRFPGSAETNCRLIVNYVFPITGYPKSHIAFNFETAIAVNDDYQIWDTLEKCQAAA
jgi:hypothetical protein